MGSILLYGLISPWAKDATKPDWVLTALQKDGTALDITGATFTAKLRKPGNASAKTMTTTWAVTTAGSGIFTGTLTAADVDTAGIFELCVKITISAKIYIGRLLVEIEDSF